MAGDGSQELFTWTDADGVTTNLEVLATGLGGRFMPPVSLISDVAPGQDGGRLREVRFGVREVELPFIVINPTQQAQRSALRTLLRLFNPTRGEGFLRCTLTGSTRELRCRYAGGLELDESAASSTPELQRVLIVLRAFDPFWYEATPMTVTLTTGTDSTFLGTPFLPIKLGSDVVLGEQTVVNDGDVEAWPMWTVAGPITSLMLQNLTTGLSIDLPVTLAAGQSLVIDTRPFRKTVRRNDGANLYGSLTATSALWSLAEGTNLVNVVANGSTSDTYVTLVYSRRHLSP